MSIELRMPSINGNEREQLIQIRSYLYQIIPQLQWALNNVSGSGASSGMVSQAPKVISAPAAQPLSPQITFDKLKDLIIDSADIVNAYYDKINERLSGLYAASSAFGDFVEKTEQNIEKTSTYTNQQFDDVQLIFTGKIDGLNTKIDNGIDGLSSSINGLGNSVGDLDSSVRVLNDALEKAQEEMKTLNTWVLESRAHIKTGLIDTRKDAAGNVFPVYGIEIGQIDTANGNEVLNRFARFTSGKLSFYDQNNTEVAYISNYKLYITNAEITGNLKLGGFIIDTSKGLKIKWEGRE